MSSVQNMSKKVAGLGNLDRDPKAYGRVAVLMGGESSEREVSLATGQAALQGLHRKGVDAHAVDVRSDTIVEILKQQKFDAAFIALHGPGGEDGVIQGLLDILRIPYTGSDVAASALAMNKLHSKRIWQSLGYPVAAYQVLAPGFQAKAVIAQLGLPVAVKPTNQGSTMGISKVETAEQFLPAYTEAAVFGDTVIAESWIDGKEFSIGIVGETALPSIYIKPAQDFYDYYAKYEANDTEHLIPSGLNAAQEAEIAEIALQAYQALGCSGWGRVDFIQDKAGHFYILEANTIPGLTPHSLVPMGIKALGLTFDDLMIAILESSWAKKTAWALEKSA